MFFVEFPFLSGKTVLDFSSSWLQANFMQILTLLTVIGIAYGAIVPLIRRTIKGFTGWMFASLRLFGLVASLVCLFKVGPEWLWSDIFGFALNKATIPGGVMQILGGIVLVFMSKFGLFEFIGVYAKPFMRKFFKLPGIAAVNAVTSYVGNYIPGSQVANQMYLEGRYTNRELAIMLCCFGTNSLAFLLIFVNMLGLMDYFNWLVVTITLVLIITGVITARLWPINHAPNMYADDVSPVEELDPKGSKWSAALNEALTVSHNAGSIFTLVGRQVIDSAVQFTVLMSTTMGILSALLIFMRFVPIFDVLGHIIAPLAALLGHENPIGVGTAVAVAAIDSMTACAKSVGLSLYSRFAINVTAFSVCICLASTIPAFLVTKCKLKVIDYIIIGFERAILCFVVSSLLSKLLIFAGILI